MDFFENPLDFSDVSSYHGCMPHTRFDPGALPDEPRRLFNAIDSEGILLSVVDDRINGTHYLTATVFLSSEGEVLSSGGDATHAIMNAAVEYIAALEKTANSYMIEHRALRRALAPFVD